jgi:hypothetical protein
MNVHEMLMVVEEISAETAKRPTAFNIYTWARMEPCGTVACYAGWALTPEQRTAWVTDGLECSPAEIAAARFGLSLDVGGGVTSPKYNAWRLFVIDYWPRFFRSAYNAAPRGLERVGVLRARVAYFIETGD